MQEMTQAEQIGKRIRTARRRKDWTQAELAERADVSKPTIFRWEKGDVKMSAESLTKLAEVLDVGEAWLRGRGPVSSMVGTMPLDFGRVDNPDIAAQQFAMAIKREAPEGEDYRVTDRRDWVQFHGRRAKEVVQIECHSAGLSPLISRGQTMEVYLSSQYVGTGPYLIRLVKDQYPYPAWLNQRNPTRMEISYPNSGKEFAIVRDDDQWRDAETDELVEFEIVGRPTRWTQSSAVLNL